MIAMGKVLVEISISHHYEIKKLKNLNMIVNILVIELKYDKVE